MFALVTSIATLMSACMFEIALVLSEFCRKPDKYLSLLPPPCSKWIRAKTKERKMEDKNWSVNEGNQVGGYGPVSEPHVPADRCRIRRTQPWITGNAAQDWTLQPMVWKVWCCPGVLRLEEKRTLLLLMDNLLPEGQNGEIE